MWEVLNLVRKIDNEYVLEVITRYEVTQGEYSNKRVILTRFEDKEIDSDFIEYDDLDKETVLGWVFNDIGDAKKTLIETTVAQELAEQVDLIENPVVLNGLPPKFTEE